MLKKQQNKKLKIGEGYYVVLKNKEGYVDTRYLTIRGFLFTNDKYHYTFNYLDTTVGEEYIFMNEEDAKNKEMRMNYEFIKTNIIPMVLCSHNAITTFTEGIKKII